MAEPENNNKNIENPSFFSSVKNELNGMSKRFLFAGIAAVLTVVLVAAIARQLKIIQGTEDSSNRHNAPAAVRNYTSNVNFNEDGDIEFEQTPEELWDELVENNNDITRYLSSPEELAKLMNVQVVTEYPYTGDYTEIEEEEKNPFLKYSLIKLHKDSKTTQGLIKLRRALGDGEEAIYMRYTTPSEFQKLIDAYNNNPTEENKQEALKYFTLEKKKVTTSNRNTTESSSANVSCWPVPEYRENELEAWDGVGPVDWMTSPHTGRDIPADQGKDVKAVESGKVIAEEETNVGTVFIYHGINDEGQAVFTRYTHMEKNFVKTGDYVEKGHIIGEVGNKGTEKYHLHFEVRLMDASSEEDINWEQVCSNWRT